MQEFLQNRNPSSQKYKEIACFHSCQIKHIKNWFSYKRKILLRISRNPSKIENKPKQEQILEKLLNETTLKIENSEERSDVITKIEYQEEIIKPLVKKEEEENQKQVVKQENCMKYKEENAFIKQKSAYIDCLALQAQMQRAYQGFWLGQMNQNYIQNYNSWVNYQSMMLQRK